MAQLDKIRLSGVTYDIIDATAIHSLDGYYTTGETNAAITAATNALAESIAEQGYQTSGDVQNAISGKADTTAVTQAISEAVSGKADTTAVTQSISEAVSGKADTTAVTEAISEAVSGKLDTSIFQTYSGNTETVLASKFAGATWSSNDKKIYFYDNASATGTALAYIDGTDFVKDGFLSSVTIDNRTISGESVPCLVFIWNTDAGIQETDIPISGIFDPTNYVSIDTFTAYTAATDTVLGGKADTTAMTEAISEATSGKVDNSTYTAFTSSTDTALAGKANTGDVVTSVSGTVAQSGFNDTYLIITTTKGGVTTDTGIMKLGYGLYNVPNTNTVAVDNAVFQVKLVSGTNIKSINGNSLLGSGDLTVDTGLHAEVSGTTLIFQ